jgi:DNA repair protein RadB
VEVKRISTGCESLDELLGGGVEKGIITNFYGESGSGKTNVCIQIAAEVAKDGGKVAYIDTEAGFSPERFIQMASEEALENVLLKDVTEFRQQDETIKSLEELDEEEDLDLVVVDSVVSLYRLKVDSDNASEVNNKLSNQLSKLSKLAREQDIPVLVTNQVYTSFDEDDLELVGRDVPKYWSKCLIKLSRADKNLREAEISKHRSRPEGRTVRFKITGEGIESSNEGIL